MNLFIETLSGCVTEQWDQGFNAMSGPKEARFIVQSLDPQGTLALFEALVVGLVGLQRAASGVDNQLHGLASGGSGRGWSG